MAEDTAPVTAAAEARLPLSAVRDVAFIAAVYLYFAGFVYRGFYLRGFGISSDPATPLYTYLVYAYDALFPNWRWLLFALAAGAAAALGITYARERLAKSALVAWLPRMRLLVAVAGALALFPLLGTWARNAAIDESFAVRRGYPEHVTFVQLHLKGEHPAFDRSFLAANERYELYFIAETAESLYVLLPRPLGRLPRSVPAGDVFVVPKSVVAYFEILANREP